MKFKNSGYLLLLFENNFSILIEQTKTRWQEILDLNINQSLETFSFISPLDIEGILLRGVTNLDVFNSVFNSNEEDKKF